MNLRDLHYLVSVAEHLHFGKAAKACHVSQPTLSMQLKKLESLLGVALLERTNKQVRLTPIGQAIVVRARRILDEAAHIKLAASAAHDPFSGTLRLGIFPTLAPYFLPIIMPKLREAFPKLSLQLVEEKTPLLLEQIACGDLDCALLALPTAGEGLVEHSLFHEPFYLAVAHHHHLASRKTVRLGNLGQETVLLLEDGHCLRDQALEICQRIGADAQTDHFRATSLETLRHMVAASDVVTLIPKFATREQDAYVRYIPFAEPQPMREIGLVWRKASSRERLFQALTEVVRSSCYGRLTK